MGRSFVHVWEPRSPVCCRTTPPHPQPHFCPPPPNPTPPPALTSGLHCGGQNVLPRRQRDEEGEGDEPQTEGEVGQDLGGGTPIAPQGPNVTPMPPGNPNSTLGPQCHPYALPGTPMSPYGHTATPMPSWEPQCHLRAPIPAHVLLGTPMLS